MLRRHAAFFSLLCSVADIFIIAATWLGVYFIRFELGLFPVAKGIPSFGKHLSLILPVVGMCYIGCLWSGLYKSRRVQNLFKQLTDISKASLLSGLAVLGFLYYSQQAFYSRLLTVLFIASLFVGLLLSHLLITEGLRQIRKRGHNLRHYVVIGAGKKGQLLVRDIQKTDWLGLRCIFFVDNNPKRIGTYLQGVPVYGPVEKLEQLLENNKVDEIYLTLDGKDAQKVYPVLRSIQRTGVTIRLIPDWGHLASISKASTVTIGSQVLFSAADSSLSGAHLVLKEIFDRVVAMLLLMIFAVPFLIIAILIKLTSQGPVFYKQIRVGMDNRQFEIIKFRTMKVDAEKNKKPGWTIENDPRRTRLGAWLRRTSMDELPQLINVIKGDMSLVGPRPERPVFTKQFSEEFQKYMFRYKTKAGMTGWAQIHGFRGDTSLKKRLQYDLYYIRNWSFGLDLRILFWTPLQMIRGKNAY